MRPLIGSTALLGLLMLMFAVVWPQNSNTHNSNAVPNANSATRNGRRPANFGNGNANYRYPGAWVDGNTNRPLVNGTWNANTNQWDIDENLLYTNAAANTPANGVVYSNAVNEARPVLKRKKPVTKKARRPTASLGGAITLGNAMSAMLASGVS